MHIDKFGLTPKQRLFCDYYLQCYNGAKSARDAGYSASCADVIAAENMVKPRIKQYLEGRMQEAIEKAGVGLDWRLEMLKKTAELCLVGKADKDGCVDAKGIIGVVSEMNKMHGSYAPTTSNLNVTEAPLEDATDIAVDAEKEINAIKTF